MKYLFIDGNNLACRCAFSQKDLCTSDGIPSGVHYGFFNSIMSLKEQFRDYQFIISWDGKSQRRMNESKSAVEKGIIKSAYKENRKKDEQPKPLLDFFAQAPFLKKAIEQTGIPQIRIPEYETDDIIASYCKLLNKDNEIVVVTGDEDYYAILSDNVSIWNGGKGVFIKKDKWIEENGIQPNQYTDVGALMGDAGDNIFGVHGVGDKGALKLIQQYGSYENVLTALHKELDPLRNSFPDLKENFQELEEITTKSGEPKYPEITINTPFTGVALAIENKEIKDKIPKTNIMILMFEDRVRLAYSLKKMDDEIKDLPKIEQGQFNKEKLLEYFDYYEIKSLKNNVENLK